MMSTAILRLQNVHARYGRNDVLRGVSIEVQAGEWFCLLGPNGAGKSTLLHCIGTQVVASQGDVQIGGHSLRTMPVAAKRLLGFATSPEALPGLLTGRQCLEICALAKLLEGVDERTVALAAQLGFTPFIDRCVDTYSLGTKQKLCVLLALLGNPRLVVLDEAFNGLDPRSALILKRHLRERLADESCAVLLATHSLDIVEHYADRAALLIDGVIARQWSRDDLDLLRARGGSALEEAVSA